MSIDSFQLLSIISDIEKSFKIKFTDKLIHDLNKKNIQDIIDLIIKIRNEFIFIIFKKL